jgi:hypothetical protein
MQRGIFIRHCSAKDGSNQCKITCKLLLRCRSSTWKAEEEEEEEEEEEGEGRRRITEELVGLGSGKSNEETRIQVHLHLRNLCWMGVDGGGMSREE